MKQVRFALALAGCFVVAKSPAISLDDIQLWTGAGTNRAALVIEWNPPIVLNNTTVPAPVANKTLVWGYRFNGTATGTQMFNAIVAANPQLYAVETVDPVFGTGIIAIGFNLDGTGLAGLADGTVTNLANAFTNGLLTNPSLNADATYPLNGGDLFWSSDYNGPYWQIWNELGDNGGFMNSPNRGTNAYFDPTTYTHGQWAYAESGPDGLTLTNGSWLGLSIAPDGYPSNTNDPSYTTNLFIFNNDVQAPPSPDGTYVAYVANTNDFAVQIISNYNVSTSSPYNVPAAILGQATLRSGTPADSTKIVEAPYGKDPHGNPVITKINVGGQITVNMGRRIYDDPNNPYGVDFVVYGNSFYAASGSVSDKADMGAVMLPSGSAGIFGHPTIVSVSQDGTNWFTYPYVAALVPDNAYRWDDANHAWAGEQMNENKPLNPALALPAGITVASALDQFTGASGGTGYNLRASGLPWIQYIRVTAGTSLTDTSAGDYTVIDALGAVNPVAVGDALSILPANLAAGVTNLNFQKPSDLSQTWIALNFASVSTNAKISTVSLHEFSSFAPVIGSVSSAYQLQARSLADTNAVTLQADIGLAVGQNYSGNGGDLRVYQWNCTNWTSQPFTFNPANHQVLVAGVTNFSAFVISQIVPPNLSAQNSTNGFAFQFTPVANCPHILQRSTDLVNWTPIYTNTPASALPLTWQDANAPAGKAFYRVQLMVP